MFGFSLGFGAAKPAREPASSSKRTPLLAMIPEEELSESELELELELPRWDKHTARKRRWFSSNARGQATPPSRRMRVCRGMKGLFWRIIMILGIVKFLSIAWSSVVLLFLDDLDSNLDSWVFPGGRPSIFSHWTTHGVVPVQCHSHNDYWRPVPLYSAIEAGCIGVEADIWLSDDELLVGHNRFTLHDAVTLRSLYLNPLLELLQTHNTRSSRLQPETLDADGTQHGGKGEEDSAPAGVFANNPYQTLALLIDFKTAGETTWPHLVKQLEPLREAGFLTFFNGVEVVNRPITVVVTGDAPFDHVLLATNTTHRDIFFDAPLDQLLEAEGDVYNYTNSDYASVDFRKTIGHLASNRFSQGQLDLVRAQVDAAHARGLRVRYWGTPTWPRGLRNHVWHVLVREQVDLINTDDLREGTMQDWRKHRSWFF